MPDFHIQKATFHDGVKGTRKSSTMIYTFIRHLVMKDLHERVSIIDVVKILVQRIKFQFLKDTK